MDKKLVYHGPMRPLSLIDSGTRSIFTFDGTGKLLSELPTEGVGYDFWILPDGNILYCFPYGGPARGCTRIVSPENEILMEYSSGGNVFSAQPLEGGYVLVGELLEKRLAVVSPRGVLEEVIPIKSETDGSNVMRMARRQPDGTYLVVHPGDQALRVYDGKGNSLEETPTRKDTFSAVRLKNGNLLYTSQTALVEVKPGGEEVFSVGKEDLPELNIHWLTGLQVLPDGHAVVVNWLGHGHEGTGVPVFELDENGKLVWTIEPSGILSAPSQVFLPGDCLGR